ncbi:MAG: 30S ribosome-binding factor RbfA, partial [Leptospira sp.]|nr:30S ribosome-binding factor RbfA [Leptospira sp.]
MNPTRKSKIESEIIKILSRLIVSGKVKDPRIGIVSLHRATLSDDTGHVKIWFTSYCSEKEKRELTTGLNSAKGFFQSVLGKELGLRLTPRIQFIWDEEYIKGLAVN